jgi:hypothetical protein
MAQAAQNRPVLPQGLQGRGIQTLNRLKKLAANVAGLASKGGAHAIHCSKEIHYQRHGRPLGPFEKQSGAALPQNALRDLPRLQNGIHFNPYALELTGVLQMSDELLQVLKRHSG